MGCSTGRYQGCTSVKVQKMSPSMWIRSNHVTPTLSPPVNLSILQFGISFTKPLQLHLCYNLYSEIYPIFSWLFLCVRRWVLGLDKAHIAYAPLHLRLPWKLSPGHAFISDGGFLSAGQTSGWNYSDHCSQCCQNLAWSSIFSALFSNDWIFNFLHLHSPGARTSQAFTKSSSFCCPFDSAQRTLAFPHLPSTDAQRCDLTGLCSWCRCSVWSSLTAPRRGFLLCVFRLESRMWGFGNPLSQPCLSDDRNPS